MAKANIERISEQYRKSWELRCVDREDFLFWFRLAIRHTRAGYINKNKFDLDVFCADANKSWCAQKASEGKCIRMDRYNTIGRIRLTSQEKKGNNK